MNRYLMLFFLCLPGSILLAQDRTASPNAPKVYQEKITMVPLTFAASEFNFGKIPQGTPVTTTFTYTNTGDTSLIIKDVHASCGCTTPEWKRDTLAPGESGKIVVGYNAAAEGNFVKPITITYNNNKTLQLLIKGEVWATPLTSAPENEALRELKKNFYTHNS